MIYNNECEKCGGPKTVGKLCAKCLSKISGKRATFCECGSAKIGGVYCSVCWPVKCPPVSIHCITAAKADLQNVVAAKWVQGLVCHGEPLAIGQGYLVQMMIEKRLL